MVFCSLKITHIKGDVSHVCRIYRTNVMGDILQLERLETGRVMVFWHNRWQADVKVD